MKTGLVLEGGAMRGLYTAGVLDALMKHGIEVDYCIGVSAGACNGVAYVSRQPGRSRRINIGYCRDPRYLSLRNLLLRGEIYGMRFLFDDITYELVPLDFEALHNNPCAFVTVVTDAHTGQAAYFGKEHIREHVRVIEASSSMPGLSRVVPYEGREFFDGGVADPIPVEQALRDGCDRLIVVRTLPADLTRRKSDVNSIVRRRLRRYPAIIEAMERRGAVYAQACDVIERLIGEGRAILFAPPHDVSAKRLERNPKKLEKLYLTGFSDATARMDEVAQIVSVSAE